MPPSRARSCAVLASVISVMLAPVPSGAALVINEVLFDPAGPDSSGEWVEIQNTGPAAAPLEGVALESGDGAGPGRWRRFWTGEPGDWIEPDGFFVVGRTGGGRAPDAPAACGLQNGPDGARLLREEWELDRVGWGEHVWPEYCEGSAAGIPPSGRSLARRLDGVDTEDNAADFEPAVPTPGRRNRPRLDLSITLAAGGRAFPVPACTRRLPVRVSVQNRGLAPVSTRAFTAFLDGRVLSFAGGDSARRIPPGDSIFLAEEAWPRAGEPIHRWIARVEQDGDEVPENNADSLLLRPWPPPLRLSEIAPRPESGGSEWVELLVSAGALVVRDWALRDAAGSTLRFQDSVTVEAGERPLAARDSLTGSRESSGRRVLRWTGSWPSLNDQASAESADTLWLLDPEGRIADWAVWGDTGPGEVWVRATDSGEAQGLDAWLRIAPSEATPGAPNVEVRIGPPGQEPTPAPAGLSLERHPDGVWLRVPESATPGSWTLRVLDLEGRELWRREGLAETGGSRWLRWDGRDSRGETRPGVVIAELRHRGREDPETIVRQPFWVAR